MTIESRMIAPPYLQFFVSDLLIPEGPVQGEKVRIISNGQCLSVPCQYRDEGDTELIVGNYGDLPKDSPPAFDGLIPTPSGIVLFSDAELTELLRFPTSSGRTRLRIWTDGSELPDRVVVGIG